MIPLLKTILYALLWDQSAARRWVRGVAHTFALGGLAFADQLAAILGVPGAVKAIKVAAIICAFVGGAISVGEKNVSAEKENVK